MPLCGVPIPWRHSTSSCAINSSLGSGWRRLRAVAQARCMSVVLKLSPLRRLIPGHEMRCPPEGNRLMWMTILATMTCAPSFFDAGNRGHLLDVGAKGARSCLHLPIELPVGVIENIDLIE